MNKNIIGPRAILLDPNKATKEMAALRKDERVRRLVAMMEALQIAASWRSMVVHGGAAGDYKWTDEKTGIESKISPAGVVAKAEDLEKKAVAMLDQLVLEAINAAVEKSLGTQRPEDVAEFVAAFCKGSHGGVVPTEAGPTQGRNGDAEPKTNGPASLTALPTAKQP